MSQSVPPRPEMKPMRELPLGDALHVTVDRLRAIAASAADAMLTEGPVHPDHRLLELCGNALDLLVRAKRLHEQRHPIWLGPAKVTDEDRRRDRQLFDEAREAEKAARRYLHPIRNTKATTAAGVFAKALIVRTSKTGATDLAMSLAEDMIACPGLRQSLWPATEGA